MAKRNAQKHATKPRTPKGAAAMPRAGRSSPKNKKSREAESRSALSGKKPGNTVASARRGKTKKRPSAALKASPTASNTPRRIAIDHGCSIPVRAEDVEARTRIAIKEIRTGFLALRDEINQWCAEVLGSVNAIAEGLTRTPGSGSHGDGKERNPSKTVADKDTGQDPAAHSQKTNNGAGSEKQNSVSGTTGGDDTPPTAQADYEVLEHLGTHRRQGPLKLIWEMYEDGATPEARGEDTTGHRSGFLWKKTSMTQKTLREIRRLLEELGYIHISHRVSVSEEAKRGKAQRKGDAAGPGYLTPRGEAVARYMDKNGITYEDLKKSRRRRT